MRMLFALMIVPWNAFAGPAVESVMVNGNYCGVILHEGPEGEPGFAMGDPTSFFPQGWKTTITCSGQDPEKRPAAAVEISSLLMPEYGSCEIGPSYPYPKHGYFFCKAKMLPDGRFQVFCGLDAEGVRDVEYFAL